MTKRNSFEAGAAVGAVAITIGNSDDTGEPAISAVSINASATLAYATAAAYHGTWGLAGTSTGTTTNAALIQLSEGTGATSFATKLYIYMGSLPNDASQFGMQCRSTTDTYITRCFVATDGKLKIANTAGTTVGTSAAALSLSTWYRLEFYGSALNGAAGSLTCTAYVGDTMTVAATVTASSVTTTGQVDRVRAGKMTSGDGPSTYRLDTFTINLGSATPIGPELVAPTAAAGADQADIEAFTTVTVTGTADDLDGTITTHTWRVISTTNSAPTPTLSGTGATRTFEAPGTLNGTVITLGYKVTDDDALDSTEDTLTVTVFPCTERAVAGGVQVPMKIMAVTS